MDLTESNEKRQIRLVAAAERALSPRPSSRGNCCTADRGRCAAFLVRRQSASSLARTRCNKYASAEEAQACADQCKAQERWGAHLSIAAFLWKPGGMPPSLERLSVHPGPIFQHAACWRTLAGFGARSMRRCSLEVVERVRQYAAGCSSSLVWTAPCQKGPEQERLSGAISRSRATSDPRPWWSCCSWRCLSCCSGRARAG